MRIINEFILNEKKIVLIKKKEAHKVKINKYSYKTYFIPFYYVGWSHIDFALEEKYIMENYHRFKDKDKAIKLFIKMIKNIQKSNIKFKLLKNG